MSLSAKAEAALAYYRDEAKSKPLGGLKLKAFQSARRELAAAGLVVQADNGRWGLA